jgi:hypothetical protein
MGKLMSAAFLGGKPIPALPNQVQALNSFIVCYNLTKLYLPIFIVRQDERTGNVFILAGEETIVLISLNGERRFL